MEKQVEQKDVQAIAEAFKVLPDGKKEFLLGYAEGVIAAAGGKKEEVNKC